MAGLRVLFLCTANSCRSQMAEGWARVLHPGKIEAFSAGTRPSQVNPLAREVMQEAGVDLSVQRSKHLNEFLGQPFDCVITLCDDARETCPVFPGAKKRVHVGFPDPAAATGSAPEVLDQFRRVRDQIGDFVARLPEFLKESAAREEHR